MSSKLPRPGDRVRLTGTIPEERSPLPIGTVGTVLCVHAEVGQIHVDWDSDRGLVLLITDPYEIVDDRPNCLNCKGTGRSARGWAGGSSPDGETCPDCRGTGVDATPYGVGYDHCPHCGADWRQPHGSSCQTLD